LTASLPAEEGSRSYSISMPNKFQRLNENTELCVTKRKGWLCSTGVIKQRSERAETGNWFGRPVYPPDNIIAGTGQIISGANYGIPIFFAQQVQQSFCG